MSTTTTRESHVDFDLTRLNRCFMPLHRNGGKPITVTISGVDYLPVYETVQTLHDGLKALKAPPYRVGITNNADSDAIATILRCGVKLCLNAIAVEGGIRFSEINLREDPALT